DEFRQFRDGARRSAGHAAATGLRVWPAAVTVEWGVQGAPTRADSEQCGTMCYSLRHTVPPRLSAPSRWSTGCPCAPTPTCHPAESLRLQAEFLDAPDLREVTLVGNDSGLFQLTAAQHPQRIARLVICSCEAFANFPQVCRF